MTTLRSVGDALDDDAADVVVAAPRERLVRELPGGCLRVWDVLRGGKGAAERSASCHIGAKTNMCRQRHHTHAGVMVCDSTS